MTSIFDEKQNVNEHIKQIPSGITVHTNDIEKISKHEVGYMNGVGDNMCTNCNSFCKSYIGVHCCNKIRGTVGKQKFCNEFNPSDRFKAQINIQSAEDKLNNIN